MKKTLISSIAWKILSWFCPDHLHEVIAGDLTEWYHKDVILYGRHRAEWKLLRNTLLFLRPGILFRNNLNKRNKDFIMFFANVKMAFRIIRKQKLFSIINIFGLSISMASCMLIFQYASYEMTYDRQHKNFENIYRLTTTLFENGEVRYPSALSGSKDGPTIQSAIPEVVATARLFATNWFDCTLAYDDGHKFRIFNENRLYYADASLLTLLNFPLLEGNNFTALQNPYSIVLSESTAKKYFGNSPSVGKIMHIKGSAEDHDYTVTAIMEDLPGNTHLGLDVLASANSLLDDKNSILKQPYTYILLQNGITPMQLSPKINTLLKDLYPAEGKFSTTMNFQPVTEIHLHSKLQDEILPGGDLKNITFLLIAAIIVMCIAWINYVNLNSSRAITRGKEVGIRKATGASRKQITFQFITETLVTMLISMFLAALSVLLFGRLCFDLAGINMDQSLLWKPNPAWYWLSVFLFSGLFITSFLPSRIIASFTPETVIKGKLISGGNSFLFKKFTLGFQFASVIVLTTAVICFNQQFNFMSHQDLRVDIGNTLILRNPSNVDSTYLSRLRGFKKELANLAIIKTLSSSTAVPGQSIGWTGTISHDKSGVSKDCRIHVIDADFINTFQLKLAAGRDFTATDYPGKHFGDKLEPVILNMSASQLLGYDNPEDAIGNEIFWDKNKCLVVGVIENFHQQSLKEAIHPTLFTANMGPSLSVKLITSNRADQSKGIATIQHAWGRFFPNNPFDYSFLEDDFNQQYSTDKNVASIITFFSVIAIVISAIGLLALSLFSLNQRIKEVSIRKVLGASGVQLFRLLTNEYFKLILIASMVSTPIAFWLVRQWLDNFAFHFTLAAWIFIIPICFVLAIALFTIGGQTLTVITRNPANTLKHE